MATSLPSVDSYLNAYKGVLPVLERLHENGRASLLEFKLSSTTTMYGPEVICCFKELQDRATKLSDLQCIVRPLLNQEDQPLFVVNRLSIFEERDRLHRDILMVFARWEYRGKRSATGLNVDGHYLYNLAQEFQVFEKAAMSLNNACAAGKILLEGTNDKSLERRFRSNLRKVVVFHKKEFTAITKLGSGRTMHFVDMKREVYNDPYLRNPLKQLAGIMEMGPEGIIGTDNPAAERDGQNECSGLKWVVLAKDQFQSNNKIKKLATDIINTCGKNPATIPITLYEYDFESLPDVCKAMKDEDIEKIKETLTEMYNKIMENTE